MMQPVSVPPPPPARRHYGYAAATAALLPFTLFGGLSVIQSSGLAPSGDTTWAWMPVLIAPPTVVTILVLVACGGIRLPWKFIAMMLAITGALFLGIYVVGSQPRDGMPVTLVTAVCWGLAWLLTNMPSLVLGLSARTTN